jgi:hypothetical protein
VPTTSEAARQAAVLRLLWTPWGQGFHADDLRAAGLAPGGEHGLEAHRRHARASARRHLIAAYPTVSAMLGEAAMGALAMQLWQTRPPVRGDVGEWGEGLADHIAAQAELAPWPWLPDAARLDWARHRCGRTASQPVDANSLLTLAAVDPTQVRLVLQPHVMTVRANWPLDALWRAHQTGSADVQALVMQTALAAHGAETQTVMCWWRDGLAQCVLSERDACWFALLATPDTSLQAALDQGPPDFDFAAWFTQALHHGWLLGAQALSSPSA